MFADFEFAYWIVFVFALHVGVLSYVWRPKRKSITGKHVVVTGGSSGIGLWTAIYSAKQGANVTIIARNAVLLEKAAKIISENRVNESQKIQFKSCDLSKDYDAVAKVLDEAEEECGPIYMLVNCAGLAICGTVESMSVADAHLLMDINYFGTYNPTRHVLPKLKAARSGIIVITASQAALLGIYGYGAYAAAKFALRGLAETISMEVSHCGVSVTLALPADTDTPGFENENKTKPQETKLISGSGGLAKPEDVAKQIMEDALTGQFISIVGMESYLVTILCSGFAPWGNFGWSLFTSILMGPLKLVGTVIQWNFRRIVRNCDIEKQNSKIEMKKDQ